MISINTHKQSVMSFRDRRRGNISLVDGCMRQLPDWSKVWKFHGAIYSKKWHLRNSGGDLILTRSFGILQCFWKYIESFNAALLLSEIFKKVSGRKAYNFWMEVHRDLRFSPFNKERSREDTNVWTWSNEALS